MSSLTARPFDYGQLDGDTCQFVQDATDEIRRYGKQTVENVIAIGRLLTDVKARLPYGQYGALLEAEFAWSERQARRFTDSYTLFTSDTVSELWAADLPKLLETLSPTSMYTLAKPSTPEPARQEVVARIVQGEIIPPKKVKEIVDRHRRPQNRLNPPFGERGGQAVRNAVQRLNYIRGKFGDAALNEVVTTVTSVPSPVQPENDASPSWANLTSSLRELLSVCRDGDAADWADGMTGEIRRDTVGKIRELRGLLEILEKALAAADQVSWPKPALVSVAATAVANAEIDDLRAWAATIEPARLAKHVAAIEGFKEPKWKLQKFVGGQQGSRDLHRALQTVRADLADFT